MTDDSTTQIDVAYPDAERLRLEVTVGACRLIIGPGDGEAWVSGTYVDPETSLPIKVEQGTGTVRIRQDKNLKSMLGLHKGTPTLELRLGRSKPFDLVLEAGASENQIELGGVPVTRLESRTGAGKTTISFSEPNPVEMQLFDVSAGAGAVDYLGLGNAGFAQMSAEGGAAACRFEFTGELKRDAHVAIRTGVASVEVAVPSGTAARMASSTTLGSIDVGDGLMKKEGAFWTEAALAGATPMLTVDVSVSLGSVALRAI